MKDLWQDCIELGAIVVPFTAYSDYGADGNYSDSRKIGLRFICMDAGYGVDLSACLKSADGFYLAADLQSTDVDCVADTPEEAIALFKAKRRAKNISGSA